MTQIDVQKRGAQFALSVKQKFATVGNWTKAVQLAQTEDEAGARAYRLAGLGAETLEADSGRSSVLSLSARPGEPFDNLATRFAIEHKVSLREAIHAIGVARPDLAGNR